MHSTFNLNRWFLLVGKHWAENHKRYLFSLLAIGGMILIWYAFMFLLNETVHQVPERIQLTTYYFGLLLAGCFYASQIFKDLSSKTKGTTYLTLPASHLEKWLCALFYAVVAFFICYTLVFYIVNIPFVHFGNTYTERDTVINGKEMIAYQAVDVINIFKAPEPASNGNNYYLYFLLAYFAFQSVFFFGSVFFSKMSFIKTICAGVVGWFLFYVLIQYVLLPMLPKGGFYNSLSNYRLLEDDFNRSILLPGWVHNILIFVLKYAFGPLFWVIAYFRLREKEI